MIEIVQALLLVALLAGLFLAIGTFLSGYAAVSAVGAGYWGLRSLPLFGPSWPDQMRARRAARRDAVEPTSPDPAPTDPSRASPIAA